MFTLYDALSDIPTNLLIPHKSFPPRKPVIVRVGMDIYQTHMNFDTGTLLVYGAAVLVISHPRTTLKVESSLLFFQNMKISNLFHTTAYISFLAIINGLFKERLLCVDLMLSSIICLTNFYFKNFLYFGRNNYCLINLSCNQESSNYPYDTYSCWENLGDYDRNETVKYATPLIRNDYMVLMPNFRHSGHTIVNYTSYKYTKDMVDIDRSEKYSGEDQRRLFNFYPELIDIGFTVQRTAPKLLATVVIPIYGEE
uniref:JmjC domain-containing protein n=1 Tax=Heterorhabditis bacteriophora TaxID=37862 RepID=A0A1I7WQT1_HETBA